MAPLVPFQAEVDYCQGKPISICLGVPPGRRRFCAPKPRSEPDVCALGGIPGAQPDRGQDFAQITAVFPRARVWYRGAMTDPPFRVSYTFARPVEDAKLDGITELVP